MEETVALGGNIELKGFGEIDKPSLVIVKKVIGNYAKRFAERNRDFSKVTLTLKTIHEHEQGGKFEIKGMLVLGGSTANAEIIDKNLFYAIDTVLKKLENEISK
jgi:ribosome-associated translation inhibitor RaiA